MSERMLIKPETCPEETCVPIHQSGEIPVPKGASLICWGRLDKVRIQNFYGWNHINTHCFCIYSPEKGHIRFCMNKSDADNTINGCFQVIADECVNPHDQMGEKCGYVG